MKKVWIIVIISIVLLAIGGITGIYIYNINILPIILKIIK